MNVCNRPDDIAPAVNRQFGTETGIKVNRDSFDSLEMLETMMLTGSSGYDARKVSAPAPDAPSEILAVTLMTPGKDPYSSDPADLAAAEAALLAIRPCLRYVNSVPILEDFAGDSLCVVVSWTRVRTGQ